jgi:hypothetical protein
MPATLVLALSFKPSQFAGASWIKTGHTYITQTLANLNFAAR